MYRFYSTKKSIFYLIHVLFQSSLMSFYRLLSVKNEKSRDYSFNDRKTTNTIPMRDIARGLFFYILFFLRNIKFVPSFLIKFAFSNNWCPTYVSVL